MRITTIETIRLEEFPNLLWVHVGTDEGLTGLGETFYGPGAAEAHIHDVIAPYLLGQDPLQIDRHQGHLLGYLGFVGSSAEMRGRSAVDIALWDLWGQATRQPLHQLLGRGRPGEYPRLQYLRGLSLRPQSPDAGDGEFWSRRDGRTVRGPGRLPEPGGRVGPESPGDGDHRHEDLAL